MHGGWLNQCIDSRPIPEFDAEASNLAALHDSEIADSSFDPSAIVAPIPIPPVGGASSQAVLVAIENFQALGSSVDGQVEYRWTPRGILLMLQLASHIRPGSSFMDVLICCVRFFFRGPC